MIVSKWIPKRLPKPSILFKIQKSYYSSKNIEQIPEELLNFTTVLPLDYRQSKIKIAKAIHLEKNLPFRNYHRELNEKLESLPPISELGGMSILRITPLPLLELELKSWRKVVHDIYLDLTGPLLPSRFRYGNKVGRIVAHTIRILRVLGHFPAAKELDRAFFTSYENERMNQFGITIEEGDKINLGNWNGGKEEFYFGKGLGLARKSNQIAWMQSLALRLEPGLYDGLEEFTDLLAEMKQNNPEQLDVCMVGFLIRESEGLLLKNKGGYEKWESERLVIDSLLDDIMKSEKFGKEGVVLKAFTEGELIRREMNSPRSDYLDSQEYQELELNVHSLLNSMENESSLQLPTKSNLQLPSDVKSIYERSHTLHLAIRFLLIHAKACSTKGDKVIRRETVAQAMESAIALYNSLMDLSLSPSINSNPFYLAKVRQRQTSALLRITWGVLGTLDPEIAQEVNEDQLSADENVPILDLSTLDLTFDLIQSTLNQLSSLQPPSFSSTLFPHRSLILPDPRIIGLPARFWRRVLTSLSLPSAPSKNHFSRPTPMRIPWPIIKKTLYLLLDTRSHDNQFITPPTSPLPVSISNSSRIFFRTSFLIHLIRACILGGSDFGDTNAIRGLKEGNQGEETLKDRLEFFLWFIDQLELRGEKVRRGYVKAAVEDVLVFEFGGASNLLWRRELTGLVTDWFERGVPSLIPPPSASPFYSSLVLYPNSIPHLPSFSITTTSISIPITELSSLKIKKHYKKRSIPVELSILIPPYTLIPLSRQS